MKEMWWCNWKIHDAITNNRCGAIILSPHITGSNLHADLIAFPSGEEKKWKLAILTHHKLPCCVSLNVEFGSQCYDFVFESAVVFLQVFAPSAELCCLTAWIFELWSQLNYKLKTEIVVAIPCTPTKLLNKADLGAMISAKCYSSNWDHRVHQLLSSLSLVWCLSLKLIFIDAAIVWWIIFPQYCPFWLYPWLVWLMSEIKWCTSLRTICRVLLFIQH